jgi:hypothetical protein
MHISGWRIECLMAATFTVIGIFPNDLPVVRIENFLSQNFVGMNESIEDESI